MVAPKVPTVKALHALREKVTIYHEQRRGEQQRSGGEVCDGSGSKRSGRGAAEQKKTEMVHYRVTVFGYISPKCMGLLMKGDEIVVSNHSFRLSGERKRPCDCTSPRSRIRWRATKQNLGRSSSFETA